jgi:hypothetical protein
VLRAGEGLQTVDDNELKKLLQEEQYVLALFCKFHTVQALRVLAHFSMTFTRYQGRVVPVPGVLF